MNVKITIEGLDQFKDLEDFEKKVDEGLTTLVDKLGNIGKEYADRKYRTAEYEGTNDVQVNFNMIGDKEGEVVAEGDAVLFIEYGSGVQATHPTGHEDGGFVEDSWSINHAREFHEKGYWWYNGKKLTGQPASMAMYEAGKEIINRAEEIAKEVFKW